MNKASSSLLKFTYLKRCFSKVKVEVLDRRATRLRVQPESEEDLWVLKTVLRPGDLVKAKTVREVAYKGRGEKERRPIVVKIKIKEVDFQAFTGKLRLFGVIVEGPEEYGVTGKHQSIMVTPGKSIEIERPKGWDKKIIEKLKSSGPKGRAVIVAVDYDEYAIAVLSMHGYKIVIDEDIKLPGKDDPSRETILSRIIDSIAKQTVETAKRYNANIVVVAGPGMLKNIISEKIKQLTQSIRVIIDNVSMGGKHGVEEALRRQTISQALKDFAITRAEQEFEEIMRVAAKEPGLVVFGLDEIHEASSLGAVEKLIMVDTLLYSLDEETSRKAGEILENAERYRATIFLVPHDSPIGERLLLMGGAIAKLRYSIGPAQ